MKRYFWKSLSKAERRAALDRPARDDVTRVLDSVRAIVDDVRANGDEAVARWTQKFDAYFGPIAPVDASAFDAAEQSLGRDLLEALDAAIANVTAFHREQLRESIRVETAPGVVCERVTVPIQRAGLYVPGGRASLPSTVYMLGVPSGLAGCPIRVLCTPPRPDGSVDPAILVAARKCGIDTVFPIGGAQAIAAMAYGTATVPKCDKLFGPGNRYVDAAKQLVALDADGPAIDLPAGPSEVLVIADASASPAFVAADLLAQAEHDTIAQCILVTTSEALADRVDDEIRNHLVELRGSAPVASIDNGRSIVVASLDEAVDVANDCAPEHLIINTENPESIVDRITTAGSIFVGPWTPEVLGDYCSGTNHVLPTGGTARAHSGLSVESFQRTMTIQRASRAGFDRLAPIASALAQAEGLAAHANAIRVRTDGSAGVATQSSTEVASNA